MKMLKLKPLLAMILVFSFFTSTSYAMIIDSTGHDRYNTLGTSYISFNSNTPNNEMVYGMPDDAIKIKHISHYSAKSDWTYYYYEWETTPSTPTCENYTFIGWYRESECTNKFPDSVGKNANFPTVVYAGWKCKHLNLITREPYPATYDKYGVSETYWECSVCHQLFSNEAGTKEIDEPKLIPKTSITHYGTDANGIKWELYEYGKLYIKGKGAMRDYTETSAIPWYAQKANITNIVVDNGVTHIAGMAFYGCVQATRIDIAESVTSIGEKAFYRCDDIVICGYKGSYAEEYAQLNEFNFINTRPLDNISLDYSKSSKKWYFDISSNLAENATVYLCVYDNDNRVLNVVSQPYKINDITSFELPIDTNAKTYKIFVWQDMLPVTNACDGEL